MGGVRVVRYRIYACIPKIYNLKLDSFVSVHGWYAFLSCALDFSFCNEYTENATVDPSNRRRADYCSVQLQSWLLLLGCRRGWDLLQTVHQIFQFMNTVDTPGQNGLLLGLCLDSSFDFLHFFLVFWKTPRTCPTCSSTKTSFVSRQANAIKKECNPTTCSQRLSIGVTQYNSIFTYQSWWDRKETLKV